MEAGSSAQVVMFHLVLVVGVWCVQTQKCLNTMKSDFLILATCVRRAKTPSAAHHGEIKTTPPKNSKEAVISPPT
jgi:hypothetical protein